MNLTDYTSRDATGLAELVARREVHPRELLDAAFAAIERVNPRLNAVLHFVRELAEGEIDAGLPDGPFTGVPFLIKEIGIRARGVPSSMGSRLAYGVSFDDDNELMARFRRAGLVTAGTTQTPEMGYSPTTETRLFGPVKNPWDPTRSAGGSSGGAGAAVASGMVPLAHGNDGGGSLRVPASCNGLVGLKPSRDRVPSGPDPGDPLCGLSCDLVLTRSVRDAAALLDAVAGPDVGAPGHPVPPAHPYREEVGAPPGRLRIAWTTTPASGEAIHPDCVRAVHETVRLLEELGHELVEDGPRYDFQSQVNHIHVIWVVNIAAGVKTLATALRRTPGPANLEAVTLACVEEGQRYGALDLLDAIDQGHLISRQVGAFFQGFDALLTPTLARPPALLGEIDQNKVGMTAMEWTRHIITYCPFTAIFNTTGQPAISLPLYETAAGLPVGVQLAGRFGDEATLLRLAGQLEEARPWSGRRPKIHAAVPAVESA